MPKLTPPQIKENERLAREALALYERGMPYRSIGRVLNPTRSRTWVLNAIRELSTKDV